MGKRRPEDILGDIEASEGEEAADKALAMPAEKRAAELEGAGVTAADVAAAGDAWHERMQRAASDEARRRAETEAREAVVRPPRRAPWGVLVAAAVAFAAIVAVALRRQDDQQASVPQPSATATSLPGAAAAVEAGVDETGVPQLQRDAPSLPEKPPLK
jgi:hypothetical protein